MMKYFLIYCSICLFPFLSSGQECLDIEFMLYNYFHTNNVNIDTTPVNGLWYNYLSKPKKIKKKLKKISEPDQFQVLALPSEQVEFKEGVSGFKVYIINNTDLKIEFIINTGRVNLIRQAFFENQWRDIEYGPTHSKYLNYLTQFSSYMEPNQYWEFMAPCVEGNLKAKFRFKLTTDENHIVYSNEWEGTVNRLQTIVKQHQAPKHIKRIIEN